MVAAKLDRLGLLGVQRHDDEDGGRPAVRNLANRLRTFTGRDQLLEDLHAWLGAERTVAALHGLGGVGKTQLALEHCYRYADDYDVVWWVDAE
jgi:hypothetical protein